MKKNVRFAFSILTVIAILALCACSSEPEIEFEDGKLDSDQSISDVFELIGTPDQNVMAPPKGDNTTYVIYVQETSDGGWVAWYNSWYTYSPNGGSGNVKYHLLFRLTDR